MLSALQLHRKTIKFQKPDTTQGGITFKARYCLLFSVLNKILRVGASGWFIMNRDSVHMICRPSPWREGLLFTGYLTRRFLASSADAQSWPVKYCAASSHSCSLHAPRKGPPPQWKRAEAQRDILLSFVFATSFSSPPLFYEHNQYHNDSEKSIRKT